MVRETYEEVKHKERAKSNLLVGNTAGRTAENNNVPSVAFKELQQGILLNSVSHTFRIN